jgi:hypothetical protein
MTFKRRLQSAEGTISAQKAKDHGYMSKEEIFFIRNLNRGLALFEKQTRTDDEQLEMLGIEKLIGATMEECRRISEGFLNDY